MRTEINREFIAEIEKWIESHSAKVDIPRPESVIGEIQSAEIEIDGKPPYLRRNLLLVGEICQSWLLLQRWHWNFIRV